MKKLNEHFTKKYEDIQATHSQTIKELTEVVHKIAHNKDEQISALQKEASSRDD